MTMRLRVMELPSEVVEDSVIPTYVLVIDRAGMVAEQVLDARVSMAESSGARGVLVFSNEVDIEP